jgi:hypothetical protein
MVYGLARKAKAAAAAAAVLSPDRRSEIPAAATPIPDFAPPTKE